MIFRQKAKDFYMFLHLVTMQSYNIQIAIKIHLLLTFGSFFVLFGTFFIKIQEFKRMRAT